MECRRVLFRSVVGLELQAPLAALAAENGVLNGCADRLQVVVGDVTKPPCDVVSGGFASGGFDHVMLNPPYLEASAVRPPVLELQRIATVEGDRKSVV